MTANKKVRIGIVGCGSVMRGPYTNQIRRIQLAGVALDVTMTCDVTQEGAATAQRLWPEAEFVRDYHAVVESNRVDLVLVLTSMQLHFEVTKAALLAGKPVLVEKPMATTLAEGKELLEISKKSRGILHPAPHVVLSATFKAMKQHIDSGDIGKPYLARAFYGWSGPNWGKWFYQRGGGALFDLGVYNVATMTALLGPAKRVTALAGTTIPERIVDNEMTTVDVVDNAHINLDFGNGVFGVITTGFTIQAYRVAGVEIYGSAGTIQMLGDDWAPKGYELYRTSSGKQGCWELYQGLDSYWPWTDGLRHLVQSIVSGTPDVVTPEHGYHVLEIMLKAEEAGRTGITQTIASTFSPIQPEQAVAPKYTLHDPTRAEE